MAIDKDYIELCERADRIMLEQLIDRIDGKPIRHEGIITEKKDDKGTYFIMEGKVILWIPYIPLQM